MSLGSAISTKTIGASTKRIALARYGDGTIEYKKQTVTTGNASSGSPNLASVASTANVYVGAPISGTGIPAGTTVVSFVADTSIVMSANATATNNGITLTIQTQPTKRTVRGDEAIEWAKQLYDALVDTN